MSHFRCISGGVFRREWVRHSENLELEWYNFSGRGILDGEFQMHSRWGVLDCGILNYSIQNEMNE